MLPGTGAHNLDSVRVIWYSSGPRKRRGARSSRSASRPGFARTRDAIPGSGRSGPSYFTALQPRDREGERAGISTWPRFLWDSVQPSSAPAGHLLSGGEGSEGKRENAKGKSQAARHLMGREKGNHVLLPRGAGGTGGPVRPDEGRAGRGTRHDPHPPFGHLLPGGEGSNTSPPGAGADPQRNEAEPWPSA